MSKATTGEAEVLRLSPALAPRHTPAGSVA